ncbi:hypothetical protein MBLNU230_g6108t1 [Neophaeotheca triangularis]
MDVLKRDYPWTSSPLVSVAPMRLISLSNLATEVSSAGGLGFIGAGSDVSSLAQYFEEAREQISSHATLKDVKHILPVGVGFLLWAGDALLASALPLIEKYKPAAVWLFAPRDPEQLVRWTNETRRVTDGATKIWIQVGTVAGAIEALENCRPDVLVVQGNDAGGHGLEKCAGLVSLVPEVEDAVAEVCRSKSIDRPVLIAAGGIMDGRGTAAALTLGASGVVMGTRYLASPEANVAKGYRKAVLDAKDGGVNTARGKLYDQLRGTTDWPGEYGGRSVLNESWYDAGRGMGFDENKRLYDEAMQQGDEGWGQNARLTTYAGTGVGLVKNLQDAATITKEVREDAVRHLKRTTELL